MRKLWNIALILFISLTMNACLDLEEKIFLRKDGSGTYSFKIELKDSISNSIQQSMQNATIDSSFIQENALNGSSEQKQLIQGLSIIEKELKLVQGIENIQLKADDNLFKYHLSFDFKNVPSLNEALKKIAGTQFSKKENSSPIPVKSQLISFSNNMLKRNHDENLSKVLQMNQLPQKKDANYLMLASIFKDLKFTSIYEFESEVKSFSNKGAVLSDNKKTLISICHPFATMKSSGEGDPCSFDNMIQFK